MKNLLLNKDFMQYTACMDGWDFKQLVEWLYEYAVNDTIPSDEEWNKASNSVCIVWNKYFPYIDYCNTKYNTKKSESDFTKILVEKVEKKRGRKKKDETDTVEGNFVGLIKPNDKF